MDIESYGRWYDFSRARDAMLDATDTEAAPWSILRSDDKKRARLNGITHILERVPYERIKRPLVELPKRSNKHKYDDAKTMVDRRFIESRY
jgi:predicted component of type VI protein secretion system